MKRRKRTYFKNTHCLLQLGRRNLIPAQKLAVLDKFKKRVAEEAREQQSISGGDKKSNAFKNHFTPNGEKRSVSNPIHTDKEAGRVYGELKIVFLLY